MTSNTSENMRGWFRRSRGRPWTLLSWFLLLVGILNLPEAFGQLSGADRDNAGETADVPPRMLTLDNDRTLNVGDRLLYQVLEEREDPVTLFVNGQGEINVPLIGRVPAMGKTPFRFAVDVKALLEVDYFYRATVIVDVVTDSQDRGRVTLIGEVRTNGTQPLPVDAILRLSEMILRSGGFTAEADTSRVALIRQGGRAPDGSILEAGRTEYDIGEMLETGNFENDPILIPDDLILVPKDDELGGEIFVLGAVNAPGAYPITREGLTVSRAILAAGGFARFAQDRRVNLVRNDGETGEKKTFTLNVKSVLEEGNRDEDMEVLAGDIIQVDERTINF